MKLSEAQKSALLEMAEGKDAWIGGGTAYIGRRKFKKSTILALRNFGLVEQRPFGHRITESGKALADSMK